MKKSEIVEGGKYRAKVSDRLVTVLVNRIEDTWTWGDKTVTRYHVTNLMTGRKTMFRSAAKFRSVVSVPVAK